MKQALAFKLYVRQSTRAECAQLAVVGGWPGVPKACCRGGDAIDAGCAIYAGCAIDAVCAWCEGVAVAVVNFCHYSGSIYH